MLIQIFAYKKENYKKELRINALCRKLNRYKVYPQSIFEILNILKKNNVEMAIIDDVLPFYLEFPIHDKEFLIQILEKTLEFESRTYSSKEIKNIAEDLLEVYKTYPKNATELLKEWRKLTKGDLYKYLGSVSDCFSKYFAKKYKQKKQHFFKKNDLQKLLKIIQNDKKTIEQTVGYKSCLNSVISDLKLFKKALKLKRKGYWIIYRFFD